MADAEQKDQGLHWVVAGAAFGLLVLGFVYYRFRSLNNVSTLADHANVGSAMAPAVAFLTLMAVIAALWSVQIQRTDLALQRKELQSTREEMQEQRKQFERTAAAQELLAKAQLASARAQGIANKIALQRARRVLSAEHGQRSSNLATLIAAEANIIATLEGARAGAGMAIRKDVLEPIMRELDQQRTRERELLDGLEETLAQADQEDEEKEPDA